MSTTYVQTCSILESLERVRPDDRSCLLIYDTPQYQLPAVTCAPGEVVDQKQIEEINRQVEKYIDIVLYNWKQLPPRELLNLIRAHTVVIWEGTVCKNLHAGQPEERLAPDPTLQEVGQVLANLRDRQRIEDGMREQCRTAGNPPVKSLPAVAPPDSSLTGCGTCLEQITTLQRQIMQSDKREALGQMATGLVYEFESRLAKILLYTEQLIDRLPPDDSRLDLAKRVLATARNTTALTNQLRAFSRPASIRPELLDLNAAVTDLEAGLRCELDDQFELRFVPAPAACPVTVDRGQLEQVLLNLVLNARDAMPKGGTITIETALMFTDHGKAQPGSGAKPVVKLSVTDTGHGMGVNTQERVFDPFFTTKHPGEGTGLGLSIVHGIVQEQFGGSISLESRLGRGTSVTAYLPRAQMRLAAAQPTL